MGRWGPAAQSIGREKRPVSFLARVARALSTPRDAGDIGNNVVLLNSQAWRVRRVRSRGYARGPRVIHPLAGKRRDSKGRLSRAIIPRSLHMAVIGDVNSGALYPANDPFRSTP